LIRVSLSVHESDMLSILLAYVSSLHQGWRKAYVLAFRKAECIREEREHGFTHSHSKYNN